MHPAMVAIPIGAFTVALVGDVLTLLGSGDTAAWSAAARSAILVGVVGALLAAVPGFIDYFGVTMSSAGRRRATLHMLLNLTAVVLYAASGWLRFGSEDTAETAIALSTLGFLLVLASGWIGGEMVFKHRIAVVEHADQEATAIGQREGGG